MMNAHLERDARLLREARHVRDGHIADSATALTVAEGAFEQGEYALARDNMHDALRLHEDATEQDERARAITGDRASNATAQRSLEKLGARLRAFEDRFAFLVGGGRQAKRKHTYKGRAYTLRSGPRGGRYILVKGAKVYV